MRSIGPGRADAADFEALEQAVRHQALNIAAQWMVQRFNGDDSDHSGFDHNVRLRPLPGR